MNFKGLLATFRLYCKCLRACGMQILTVGPLGNELCTVVPNQGAFRLLGDLKHPVWLPTTFVQGVKFYFQCISLAYMCLTVCRLQNSCKSIFYGVYTMKTSVCQLPKAIFSFFSIINLVIIREIHFNWFKPFNQFGEISTEFQSPKMIWLLCNMGFPAWIF